MHKFLTHFDCGGNTRLNNRTNQRYEYFMQENGVISQSVVIVDHATAKVIQNTHHILSVHFNNDAEKYGLVGAVFKDTNILRNLLEKLNSEEVK